MNHSESLTKLATALVKCQAMLQPAEKSSLNPFFKSKYADLSAVWDAAREPLTKNGLSVVQLPGFENGVVTLTTVLLHESGEWLSAPAGAPIAKADAQGVGSCISYLRRYALASVVGIVAEDDDGNAATQGRQSKAPPKENPGVSEDGQIRLPGKPEQWDGHGGKPIADIPEDVLTKAGAWLHKKDPVKNKLLVEAITEELERRRVAA